MHKKLTQILAKKRCEVKRLKQAGVNVPTDFNPPVVRDFRKAISRGNEKKINLIAEIKFASPSKGRIRDADHPEAIAKTYEKCGASAISYLTDETFFSGDLERLPPVKESVDVPILRKDFIIDEIQVRESAMFGADAILLIARILSASKLKTLLEMTHDLGLIALVEIHDPRDLEKALNCGAEIIGINNRDLDTFQVDLNTTLSLAPQIPEHCTVVSESGIETGDDVRELCGLGIDAVLVGTSIMKSEDMGRKVKELVSAGQECK